MTSPICQVKDGAGSYQDTGEGVDVTPGNTITIKLSDSSVKAWLIECATTDELSDAVAITSALVIDPLLKTATFTAPVAGRCYRFQSVVENGNANGKARPDFTTTFCIYTLATNGLRCHAVDEEKEGGPFGATPDLNEAIRQSGVGGGTPGGVDGELQAKSGSSFIGATGIGFDGTDGLTFESGKFISFGLAPAQAGPIRLPNGTGIFARNAAGTTDHALIYFDASDNLFIGDSSVGENQIVTIVNSWALTTPSAYVLKASTTMVESAHPIYGYLSPYGAHGQFSKDMNNANYALANTEYVFHIIKITSTTAFTADRTLTLPSAADDAHAYTKVIDNRATGANLIVSDGTNTLTMAPNTSALVIVDAAGPRTAEN